MSFVFARAVRSKARLRLAISAPSGAGKTMGALVIAKSLGGRIALIDTERESASLYAEPIRLKDGSVFQPPEFDTVSLAPPYAPERFIEALHAAGEAGYGTVILDSASHEWNGSGGCLEINDTVARARFQGNTWSAWNETTPRHRKFLDALISYPGHVIVTLRSKTETAQEKNAAGKTKVIKLGMKAEQRDGVEYEFTVVLDLVHDGHYALASKDRTGLFTGADPAPITAATGDALLHWLESGAEPLPDSGPWYEGIARTIDSAADKPQLAAAWDKAKAECQKNGDQDAYAVLKGTMERTASALREAAGAQPTATEGAAA